MKYREFSNKNMLCIFKIDFSKKYTDQNLKWHELLKKLYIDLNKVASSYLASSIENAADGSNTDYIHRL